MKLVKSEVRQISSFISDTVKYFVLEEVMHEVHWIVMDSVSDEVGDVFINVYWDCVR